MRWIWFGAYEPTLGRELWSTDGTPAGTRLAVEVQPGYGTSLVSDPVVWRDALWFAANHGLGDADLSGEIPDGRQHLARAQRPGEEGDLGLFDQLAVRYQTSIDYDRVSRTGNWIELNCSVGSRLISN